MRLKETFSIFSLGLMLAVTTANAKPVGSPQTSKPGASVNAQSRLAREVGHELATLPWYGVFDWVEGAVAADGRVVLKGWVTRPSTREDAEERMKEIEGISMVTNEIEVLPLSPSDNRLRRSLYLALFEYDSPLFRYALGSTPSIHIIVNNGRVVLKGAVASKVDRETAEARANSISGIFEVRNDLMIDPVAEGD